MQRFILPKKNILGLGAPQVEAKFKLERDSNPDLCNASAVLYELGHQANWELVIMWVNNKPVDSGYVRSK